MNMSYLNSLIVSGLVVGTMYGMVAMGFAVVYKVSRVVNFAQGEFLMLIAFISYSIALHTGGSLPIVIASVLVASIVLGLVVERLLIRPMLGQPIFSIVMMTIALAVLLRSLIGLFWGTDPMRMPGMESSEPFEFMGASVSSAQLILVVVYLCSCAGIWAFLRYSVIGIAMRAAATEPTVTLLMGLSVSKLYRVAWILSALLAGMAGVLFASIYHVGLDMGHVGIQAFPATILGGLDSIMGSAIGGLIIGVAENLAGGYIGSGYRQIAGFAIILIVLMVRPHGLFGEKDIERV